MKKIELHVHLDGSVREETLKELLYKENEFIPDSFCVDNQNENLNAYLEKFIYPIKVMQTKDNLKRISYELVCDLKKEDIVYAEIRFAPLKHLEKGLKIEEVVESVLEGLKKGPIKTNLILCCMRNDDIVSNKKVVDIAHKYNLPIDLAGAEALYETKNFMELFDYAKTLNVPYTIHAGEACGKDSILSAISFGTKRIGHGIKVDEEVIEEYIKNDITLEVCPTSNIQTKAISNFNKYPLYDLYKRGVKVTVNTDNRTVSNTTLSNEYNLLNKYFSFKEEDFMKMNLYALEASFLNEEEKEKIKEELGY